LTSLKAHCAALLRRTAFHPQWLLGGQGPIRRLLQNAGGRVADIGSAGEWVRHALPDGCQYVAIDFPATATERYGTRPDVFADAAELPFRDGSFDTVVLFDVLEHLGKPNDALREIARLLRPGGSALLSVPFLYPIHDAPHDFQRLTPHGLRRDVELAGLQIESMAPARHAIETGGLLMALALGGTLLQAARSWHPGLLLAPLCLGAIVIVNLTAWIGARLMPDWPAMSNGYYLHLRR
jgi:SAM-dependent methyltransferase